MAADPNIFQQYLKPVRSVQDYSNDMDTAEANALTLAGQRQTAADDQAVRTAYQQSGGDQNKLVQALQQGGQYKAAQALQDKMLTQKKTQGDIDKQSSDLIDVKLKQSRQFLDGVTTPEQYIAWHEANHADPVLGPVLAARGVTQDSARASIQASLQQPGGFEQLLNQSKLGVEKFAEMNKPSFQTRNTGGTTDTLQIPGMGGAPTVISTIKNTQSPDSVASTASAAAGRAQAERHFQTSQANAGPDVDPAQTENIAKMIAEGRMAPLGQMAMRSPAGVAIMARVAELNPEFRAQTFGTGSKAEKDFATGKQGNAVRSFNVSLTHLDTLSNLADALNNKDTQLINKLGNYVGEQTGSPAPTNFNAAKKIVADEIVKAIVGGGGGVADREEASRTIQAANSPAQLKGVISTYKELMNGQLSGLQAQYKSTTGRDDFDKYLSPQAIAARSHGKPTAPAGDIHSQADAILRGK